MKRITSATMWWLTFLSGALLVFIGLRFFAMPQLAETAFGINTQTNGDFSFHYIKGGRDLVSGSMFIVLLLLKQYRALGVMLLIGSLVPSVDLWVVASHPGYETARIYPHLTAIILGLVLGWYYVRQSSFNIQLSQA
ncbi:protein of unknown function [Chitinophaga rupis]|uniref:DUF4267 domain-containing protein n=1 Tax=Chitinophaga rupis TaxID=573321 RepID=A0A1H7ZB67_9BACT|nr:DUF4267 domain-containing protein [Chitinophaga rupis]SEM54729.1 protein of unknown function [Chitinophaga rupis]